MCEFGSRRSALGLVLLGAWTLVVCAYVVWQLWWMSSAWGLVRYEGETPASMGPSIELRMHRIQWGVGALAIGGVCCAGAGAWVWRVRGPGRGAGGS